jgi:hypothetical protein
MTDWEVGLALAIILGGCGAIDIHPLNVLILYCVAKVARAVIEIWHRLEP